MRRFSCALMLALAWSLPALAQPTERSCELDGDALFCQEGRCERQEDGTFLCDDGQSCEVEERAGQAPLVLCQTRERDRDPLAPPDEPLAATNGECKVAIVAHFIARKGGSSKVVYDPRDVNQENLAQVKSEVTVPTGFDVTLAIVPLSAAIAPFKGAFSLRYDVQKRGSDDLEELVPKRGRISVQAENAADLDDKYKRERRRKKFPSRPLGPGREVVKARITATWDPDREDVPSCSVSKEFKIVHQGTPERPTERFNLGVQVAGVKRQLATIPRGTRTRTFPPSPPPVQVGRDTARKTIYLTPLTTFWTVDEPLDQCCRKTGRKHRIIQFARAYTDGEYTRQGKDWGLDILPSRRQAERGKTEGKKRKKAKHNPTFTNDPGRDRGLDRSDKGSGGTSENTSPRGLLQFDAPGMPQSLYDKLASSDRPATFVQQFVALLVCAPKNVRRAKDHLAATEVKHVLVVTIRWSFPGQGKAPQVTRTSQDVPANCDSLATLLRCNSLTQPFNNPRPATVPRLKPAVHDALKKSVEDFARDAKAQVKLSCP